MAFRINETDVEINTNPTIGEFLRVRNIDSERVVIEYNGEVLPKNKFDFTKIKNGDNIEILSFVGGG